jgi:hypothetical protein
MRPAAQAAHPLVHELCAAGTYLPQEAQDRVAVNAGQALGRADGVAFDQAVDGLNAAVE